MKSKERVTENSKGKKSNKVTKSQRILKVDFRLFKLSTSKIEKYFRLLLVFILLFVFFFLFRFDNQHPNGAQALLKQLIKIHSEMAFR